MFDTNNKPFSAHFIDKVYSYNNSVDYIRELYENTKSIILTNFGTYEIYDEDLSSFLYIASNINDNVKISKIQTFLYFSDFYIANIVLNKNIDIISKVDITVYNTNDNGFDIDNDDEFSEFNSTIKTSDLYNTIKTERNELLILYRHKVSEYLNTVIVEKLSIKQPDDLIVIFKNVEEFIDINTYLLNLDIFTDYNIMFFNDRFTVNDIILSASIITRNYSNLKIKLDNHKRAMFINKNTKEFIIDNNIFVFENINTSNDGKIIL